MTAVYTVLYRDGVLAKHERDKYTLFFEVQSTHWKAEEVVQRSFTVAYYYPTLFYWLHTPKIETRVLTHYGLNSCR